MYTTRVRFSEVPEDKALINIHLMGVINNRMIIIDSLEMEVVLKLHISFHLAVEGGMVENPSTDNFNR
jgi:hypothetical protein